MATNGMILSICAAWSLNNGRGLDVSAPAGVCLPSEAKNQGIIRRLPPCHAMFCKSHQAQKARPADSSEQLAGAIALAKAGFRRKGAGICSMVCVPGVLAVLKRS